MIYSTKTTFRVIAFTMLTALIFVTATTQTLAGNGKKNRAQMTKQRSGDRQTPKISNSAATER